jgi:hypothetical protein
MNMQRTISIGIAVLLLAIGTFMAIPGGDADVYAETDHETAVDDYSVYKGSSLKIINLSDTRLEDQKSEYNLNDDVVIEYTIPSRPTNDIILIDSDWVAKNNKTATVSIPNLIKAGHPVVLIGDDFSSLAINEIGTAFVKGASIYGVFYHKASNTVSCYSIVDYAPELSLSFAYNWAVNSAEKHFPKTIQSNPTYNNTVSGQTIESYADITCGSFGFMHIRTDYLEVLSNNSTKSFFIAEYNIQSDSNGGSKRTTGLRVVNDADNMPGGRLKDYGPTTSSGTTTVSMSASVGVGMAIQGPTASASFSVGWSYSTPDVMVIDDSSFGTNTLNLFHQINVYSNAAQHTYVAEPGAIYEGVKNSSGSTFYSIDTYTAEFREKYLIGHSSVYSYNLSCQVNIAGI